MRLYSTDSISLDQDRWPRKPYCSNDVKKYGQFPRTFKCAVKYRQIQPNPPGLVFRMVLDIDKPRQPEPVMSWHMAGLPPPNWIAQNPENGHCHLSYELSFPVSLADWLPRKKIKIQKPAIEGDVFSIGRNCAVFDILRKKAYEIVPSFWEPEGFPRFQEAVLGIVEDAWDSIKNHDAWADKTHPYRLHEIRNTATSIAKWTWKNFTPTTRAKMIKKTHSAKFHRREPPNFLGWEPRDFLVGIHPIS